MIGEELFFNNEEPVEKEFEAEIKQVQQELEQQDAERNKPDVVDPEVERLVLEDEKPAPRQAEPAPVPEPVEEKPQQRQVPLEALKEEREKRQALERRLAELEQRVPQPQYEEPKIPDVNEDPIGAIEWTQKQLREQQQARAEQEARTRIISQAQALTAQYAEQTPDYKDAYAHVLNVRRMQHQIAGVPQERLGDALANDEMEIIQTAFRTGRNPGELVYEYAKTFGYAQKAPENKQETPVPAPTQSLELEAKKAAAATSLVRGKATAKDLVPDDIVGLKGAAFDAAWEKVMAANNRPKAHGVVDGLRSRRR